VRLKVGQNIPNELYGDALSGQEVSLEGYIGKPFILSFYRYAGCQFCNLRIHDFIKRYKSEYQPAGVSAIAVFQSPINKMEKYTTEHQAPFEFISDPRCEWYKAFRVEKSWAGFAKAGSRVSDLTRSIAKGYGRIDPDGAMNRIPADFLISAEGVIEAAYYGKDIGDHIPFSDISEWIDHT